MAAPFHNRVRETATVSGTGNIVLNGAVAKFVPFSSVYSVGDVVFYAIVGNDTNEWEVGRGTMLTTTLLTRGLVLESSNANTTVTFTATSVDAFHTIPGNYISSLAKGRLLAHAGGFAMS